LACGAVGVLICAASIVSWPSYSTSFRDREGAFAVSRWKGVGDMFERRVTAGLVPGCIWKLASGL
jgi:hypothetical protein